MTALAILLSVAVGAFAMWLWCREAIADAKAETAQARAKLADALPLPRFDAHEWQRLGSEAVDRAMRGVEL